jgi:hypothetical protein
LVSVIIQPTLSRGDVLKTKILDIDIILVYHS